MCIKASETICIAFYHAYILLFLEIVRAWAMLESEKSYKPMLKLDNCMNEMYAKRLDLCRSVSRRTTMLLILKTKTIEAA